MMDDTTVGAITNAIAILGLLAVTYGKFIGAQQTKMVQALIDGFQIKSRYRPAANFLTGIGAALLLSVFLAVWLGSWEILVIGFVAGIFASGDAAAVHDSADSQVAKVKSVKATDGTTTSTTTTAELPVDDK